MNASRRPSAQKPVEVVRIPPPPAEQRAQRNAVFAGESERRTRYSMPVALDSHSPVGYRHRIRLSEAEARAATALLSIERPHRFIDGPAIEEQELFDECSLGVLSSRQSTNYMGHRQVSLGPEDSMLVADRLKRMSGVEADVLGNAASTHVVLSKPYRTPFTMLLTFIGHKPWKSLGTVPARAWDKKVNHADDIPTIGYLQQLHIGILADAMERAAVIASSGARKANVLQAPFVGAAAEANAEHIRAIEDLVGLSAADRRKGWRIAFVGQTGYVGEHEQIQLSPESWRRIGANLLAFRSERIQPGVNAEAKAPPQYQQRQDMDVPDELTVMAGRAAYNAFVHWTGVDRERSKDLLLLERVDVLTPNGRERLRQIREHLGEVTERVITGIPLWADLPTGRALTRNAARGKKAFALAGQRIYIGGLDRGEIEREGIDWSLGVRAFGAAAARSALVAELMGVVDLPEDCDLLAGICLMAGPVNQNDIGKAFYGMKDMLCDAFPDRDPTSLLVWTLKAKTVADPIGNEEQLLNAKRKGALVDLRPGPHDVVAVKQGDAIAPMRHREGRRNAERAFADVGNFVTDPDGRGIPGNRGSSWPEAWRHERVW